jgi:hypothetical protein
MGDLVERRIFHIAAAPTTYQPKQIGFDGSVDAELGFTMVCAKDPSDNITKCLAKDKPARVQSFRILNGQFSWNFNEAGNVGTLSVANSVTSLGKLEFSDDLLTAGGIKARFADDASEAADFLSDFGNVSLMSAISWLYDNSALAGLAAEQVLFGNRGGSGTLEQSSALTFNSNSQLLIGTGPDKIGTAANSLFVGGKLEVDGNADFDEWVNINAGIFIKDDLQICLGNSSDARIEYDSTQTQNALVIGTDTTSRTLIIADRSAVSPTPHNFAIPARDDPTIAIMAADQVNTKGLLLSWDRIVGGDTVTAVPTTQRVIAMGASLALNGDMSDSLIMGSGSTVDADNSLVVGDSLTIGQGSGHGSSLGDKLVAIGEDLVLDASGGFFIGSTIDAESQYSSAVGADLTVTHDYAMARGRYVTTMAAGARHWGMDRHNSVDGTAQGIDGLIQVGVTTGNESISLHDTFGGSGISILLPDGVMAIFEIELISSIFAADHVDNGYSICSRRIICWNNAGYMAWNFETANQAEIKSDSATWTVTIAMTSNGNTGFNVRVTVADLSGSEVLTHVARLRGFTSQTSMIKSS